MANPFFYPYYGGTEKVLMEVGKHLSKRHSLTVLTARLKDTPKRENIGGIEIVRLPATVLYSAPHPFPPPVPIIRNAESWIRDNIKDYDVVHINNRFIFSPEFGNIAVKNGKKLCLTIHNSRPKGIDLITDIFGGMFDDLVATNLMRRCDGIAGVSDAALHSTLPKDFSGKRETIYNGVDQKTFSPRKSDRWENILGIDGRIVLTNARLIRQKGLPYLVDAMKGIDASLVIFGRGPMKDSLLRRAKRNNVDVRVVDIRMTDTELADLYRIAGCFVMPSLYDPCPLALLEGMSSGLPCVVTDAGGMKELVEHEKSGIVVPRANSDALGQAIKSILEDRNLARRLGREARNRVVERFTWEAVADRYDGFFSGLF